MRVAVFLAMVFLCCVFAGCNWFDKGLLNIINPEAEVKMYYVFQEPPDIGGPDKFELLEGLTFDLVLYPLNEVGFTLTRLTYTYTTEKNDVPELTKTLLLSYYIPPNSSLKPEIPGPEASSPYVLRNLPLFFQDTIDYLWKHYGTKNLFLTLRASLEDDSGHFLEKTVVANFPVLQFGEDFWAPTDVTIIPSNLSTSPGATHTFLAQAREDYRIASYQWFVNGKSQGCGGGATFTYTFTEAGTYTITVKVCDVAGNCAYGATTVTVK